MKAEKREARKSKEDHPLSCWKLPGRFKCKVCSGLLPSIGAADVSTCR